MRPRKLLPLLIAAVLLIPAFPASAAAKRDVAALADVAPTDWFYPYVKRLYEDGVINGVAADRYAPYEPARLTELAALITRYLGLEGHAARRKAELEAAGVPGASLWYSGYIQTMADAGILRPEDLRALGASVTFEGYVFIPLTAEPRLEAPVLRKDAARYIARSFELDGVNVKSNRLSPEISSARF